MAQVDDIDKERLVAALYELLHSLGFEAAADSLHVPGFISIPRSMASTRDGREEIIFQVQQAFEDPTVGTVFIQDGKTLAETLAPYEHQLNTRTVGYA